MAAWSRGLRNVPCLAFKWIFSCFRVCHSATFTGKPLSHKSTTVGTVFSLCRHTRIYIKLGWLYSRRRSIETDTWILRIIAHFRFLLFLRGQYLGNRFLDLQSFGLRPGVSLSSHSRLAVLGRDGGRHRGGHHAGEIVLPFETRPGLRQLLIQQRIPASLVILSGNESRIRLDREAKPRLPGNWSSRLSDNSNLTSW